MSIVLLSGASLSLSVSLSLSLTHTHTHTYIYIYILSLRKTKDLLLWDYEFIFILLCVSDLNQKHEEKFNRTSSDLMDKTTQNRHRVGMEVLKSYLLVFFSLPFFLFVYLFLFI